MKQIILGLPAVLLLVSACSKTNDFTPVSGATGEDIFKTACVECHTPKQGGHYFELDSDMANTVAIAKKVNEGSMAMPLFPQIQGEALQSLSEYVLANSKSE